jgi:hypothetical protein
MRFSCRRATYLTVQAMGLLGTTAVAEPVALENMALASSQWPISPWHHGLGDLNASVLR